MIGEGELKVSQNKETKTIMEFLSENPNVDVSHAWERCWGIQTGIIDRVKERFSVEKHPSCAGRDYFVSEEHPKHGQLEGSFTAYSGEEVDRLVHSWLGNRQRSILDINATVFLGQETRVPHLAVIFGTIPFLYFYAEYTPRVDLRTNPDYLMKYYEPVNKDFLEFRAQPNWTRFVSHGTYLRSLMSPVCVSSHTELNDENIDRCERYLETFINRWFQWLDEAETIPLSERAAQQEYDLKVRELGYRYDPMNVLPVEVFGQEEANRMLDLRIGVDQIKSVANRWERS